MHYMQGKKNEKNNCGIDAHGVQNRLIQNVAKMSLPQIIFDYYLS